MRCVYPSDISVLLFPCCSLSTDPGQSVSVLSFVEVSVTSGITALSNATLSSLDCCSSMRG